MYKGTQQRNLLLREKIPISQPIENILATSCRNCLAPQNTFAMPLVYTIELLIICRVVCNWSLNGTFNTYNILVSILSKLAQKIVILGNRKCWRYWCYSCVLMTNSLTGGRARSVARRGLPALIILTNFWLIFAKGILQIFIISHTYNSIFVNPITKCKKE